MRKNVESILFWGSLWGLEEATLGHLLHLLPINIGWLFWFPLAYFFMHSVYKATNKVSAIFYTSLLTAAIKLVDLFLPIRIDKVINPSVAIIFEGMAVLAVYYIIEKRPQLKSIHWGKALSASLFQELLYITYIAIIPKFVSLIPAPSGVQAYLTYIYHGFVNALIIFLFLHYSANLSHAINKLTVVSLDWFRNRSYIKTIFTASPYLLLIITVVVQWAL